MICFLNTFGEVVYTVTEPNSCLVDSVHCSVSELIASLSSRHLLLRTLEGSAKRSQTGDGRLGI